MNPLAPKAAATYRGRLAPTPTGYLHLGHARTFWTAFQRARDAGGILILRNEDLDPHRCRDEFAQAMLEDLQWFGLSWHEGPDTGGPCAPYRQSQRRPFHLNAFESLRSRGFLYPCTCSRKDVLAALQAPHQGEDEPLYPGTCRPRNPSRFPGASVPALSPGRLAAHWRFRVPVGESIRFEDGCQGPQRFVAGVDFGDFIVWRNDDTPSYHLAVVADDAAMQVTEVVRGEDLLKSTARQLLLYRALEITPPAFYHCPLVCDASGRRLAKRHQALSLRALRQQGCSPQTLHHLNPPGLNLHRQTSV